MYKLIKRTLLATLLIAVLNQTPAAIAGDKLPVNLVQYSELFASAGQPNADYIADLAKRNFDIVINIAPATAHGALEKEAYLVSAAGMTYLNIPVAWDHPRQSEFDLFQQFMQGNAERKIFLHCQMNMRASAYAFLHRVINLHIEPQLALQDLLEVWTPNATWAAFINTALARREIDFTVPGSKQ